MKFIEIKEGLSVSREDILAIEKMEEFTCKVHTIIGSFDSSFPYITLLQILEEETPDDTEKKLEHISTVVDTLGHYAG